MKTNVKTNLPFILCMTTIFLFFFICAFQKKGTFIDEMMSYDLSNRASDRVVFMTGYVKSNSLSDLAATVSDILDKGWSGSALYEEFKASERAAISSSPWRDGSYYLDMITAGKDSRFDFLSVMYNSVYDSHPPFYYLMLHSISSLFPGVFSLWFGLAINLLFLTLACGMLYHITVKFFGGTKYAWLVTMLYAVSVGGLSTLYILRMYALFTFFILSFLAVNLHLIRRDFCFNKKLRLLYILTAALGFYTQYFFVFYAVFLIGTIVITLALKADKRKCILPYIANSVIAGIVSLILFPFSIKNIFLDSFGKSTIQNAVSGHYIEKFIHFLQLIVQSLFINWGFFAAFLLLLGGLFIYTLIKKENRGISRKDSYLRYLFLPAVLYFIMVSMSAPFISDRYLMCIFPLLLLSLYAKLKQLMQPVTKKAFSWLCIIGAVFTLSQFLLTTPRYIYQDQDEKNALIEKADETICVYVSGDALWKFKTCLQVMSRFQKTAVISKDQTADLSLTAPPSDSYERVVICIDSSIDQETVLHEICTALSLNPKTAAKLPAENDEYTSMYVIDIS